MAILGLMLASVQATTITGIAGGNDSWNTAANWDAGVPNGAVDVVVGDGVWAQVNNASTPLYTGSLTLNNNSTLTMAGAVGSENAVAGASGITMNNGSKIQVNLNANINFPPITLAGNVSLESLFGASDHQTDNFSAITGTYTLTISGFNNHTYNLNAANSFSELIANAIDRYHICARAAGSLGNGDVTINPRADGRSASLHIDAANAMADTATLYLNGTAGQGGYSGTGSDYVIMNADDTIAALFVYGVEQPPGNYTNSESWLQGSGTLRVVPINPKNPSPAFGVTVPAGDVVLSWTNMDPCTPPVYVDVWFGTEPGSLAQVPGISGIADANSVTVSAPVADTYYWRVDSYINGSPTGDPIEGTVFTFKVDDTDSDGLPDAYELLHTSPPSPTALNPGDDLEPDGLTNIAEYHLGTNPNDPDTDDDTLLDGDEIAGAGLRPPTNPLNADTDNDGLDDGVETNTGIYVSATDTGTNPTDPDCDGDGLKDGVETNTGIFVSATDTGTDPTVADSDSDDAEDWYEVAASFTDPTDPNDSPVVPYPMPDPGTTSPDTTKPVKVFVLAGQSNMVGMGNIGALGTPGTLETITKNENKFPHLVDAADDWTVRNDVYFYEAELHFNGGWLTVPPLPGNSTIGPELQFGHIMGFTHDEQVLVIKTSNGNRSLGWDYRPPSLPYHPNNPDSNEWEGKSYRLMMQGVNYTLSNISTILPGYAGQGYEIAGFCWFQGHKDQYDATNIAEYELNLTALINDIRSEQYGFNEPNLPVVIATIGFNGWDMNPDGAYGKIHTAQMAVSDPVKHPEFAGNVITMDTRGYWREVAESPANQGYHYNRNSESFMLFGDALGRGMVKLLKTYSVSGDCNKDGRVDFKDLACLALYWLQTDCGQCCGADLNGDEKVDIRDVAAVAAYWLTATTIPPLPEPASGPNPPDGATEVSRILDLNWTAGAGATSHDLYIGWSDPPPFRCNQTETRFSGGTMAPGTTYYWRIDERNGWGTTEGPLWSFTTTTGP
jgi:alpha-galactosidase